MSELAIGGRIPTGRANRFVIVVAVAFILAGFAGVWGVFRFVEAERQRDLQSWQVRLGVVADTRAAAVGQWLDSQIANLRDLADNASLQIYMTELMLPSDGGASEPEPAEYSYLRNLLEVTAQRSGFDTPIADTADIVAANVERVGLAGLALTDVNGNVVVATATMPPPAGTVRRAMADAASGRIGVADMYVGASGEPTMGFAVPVYAIQADDGASEPIGLVVGLRLVGNELFDQLQQPGDVPAGAETYLVRKGAETIEYLSPLSDGSAPLKRVLAQDTPDLAAAFVIGRPGGFAIGRDYKSEDVLVTGRALTQAPWYIVRTIASREALTEINARARTLSTIFLTILAGVAIALVAVWRHGSSLRATAAAERYRETAEKFENVTSFLRVVTDGLTDPLIAVDRAGRYIFANMAAAQAVEMHPRDMIGKTMTQVIGPARAAAIEAINKRVLDNGLPAHHVHRYDEDGQHHVVTTIHLRLPVTRLRPDGVLVRFDDITNVVTAQERRERVLGQLIETLVGLVDRRDPFAAGQSAHVSDVARAIAQEMRLSEQQVETVEIAGRLLNVGKLLVAPELLRKTDALTDDERAQLNGLCEETARLLAGVDFDGPVVETVRQAKERWDGSGPLGLRGEAIEMCARILAVANAFVGMVSVRAYRDAMSLDHAANALLEDAGGIFDRRVVSALLNHIENRGGRAKWAHFGARPESDETSSNS